jgi:putative redox protein
MKSRSKLVAGSFQSIADNGGHHGMVLDLPEAKEGTDLGPTALELTVMSLAGCISTIWAVVAKNSKVSYNSIVVDIDAEKPDDAPTITSAKATVTVNADDEQNKLERCLQKTMKACPVGQLFEKAGIEIETELIVE